MTDRASITLRTTADRQTAARWCSMMRDGTRVEFKAPRRSTEQNDLMWARLTTISKEVIWYGHTLSPEDWKDVFTAGLRKALVVPDLEGTGFVMVGLRTSKMTVSEMTNLLDLIAAFAAERGVAFPGEDPGISNDGRAA